VWRPPALATGRPSVPPLSNFQWDPPAPAWNKTKIAHCNNDKWPIEVQSMIPLCSPVMPSFSDLPACLCDLVISCDILWYLVCFLFQHRVSHLPLSERLHEWTTSSLVAQAGPKWFTVSKAT
jgi:hypothetical protein